MDLHLDVAARRERMQMTVVLRVFLVVLILAAACAPPRTAAPPAPVATPNQEHEPVPPPPHAPAPAPDPIPAPRAAHREGRALWVTRFDYDSPARIASIMERARQAHFNVIYFQVRGTGDAFYRSSLEPCSVTLCGVLGGSPRYDPLEVAVREAHARGLQLHAWLNALPGFAANTPAACAMLRDSPQGRPLHMLRRNPELVMRDGAGRAMPCPNPQEYLWLSPAHPEVRTQLARVAADIARRYAIDGVHLDRIRFPGSAWSHDARSLQLFGRAPATDPAAWSDFRRMLINLTVRETYDSLMAERPGLALSAAVWGIYDDKWQWRSSRGYGQFLQDPLAWAADGYLDVAAPMTYFRIGPHYCSYADWACLLDDHVERIQEAGRRHVYIGIDARMGADEMARQIQLGRRRGVVGFAVYSYALVERTGAWDALRLSFGAPAEVPPMPWKPVSPHAAR